MKDAKQLNDKVGVVRSNIEIRVIEFDGFYAPTLYVKLGKLVGETDISRGEALDLSRYFKDLAEALPK